MASSPKKGHSDPERQQVDTQVEAIVNDKPLRNLCDVVTERMLPPAGGRSKDRPILSRIMILGEIANRDDPPRAFFEDMLVQAAAAVNAEDPLGGRIAGTVNDKMGISGILMELPEHFAMLLESEPQHIQRFMSDLHGALNVRKAYEGISNLQIAFYADDIIQRGGSRFLTVELSSSSGSSPSGKLEEVIVQQLHKMMQINRQVQTQPPNHVDAFMNGLKSTHAQDLPTTPFVQRVLASKLCLELDEYEEVFGNVPQVIRDCEVVHPVEPPMVY